MKFNIKYIGLVLFVLTFVNCAKRGMITGGDKDTIAPKLVNSYPENFKTNFKGNEIKINFDELIKVKDINKNLIISPPFSKKPIITPQGSASKSIKIQFIDSLQPNTTYSLNFGNSIVDNNEGNPYSQFKYVFSTGNIIDSLKYSGEVVDAFEKEIDQDLSILLYDEETFNDSLVFKKVPLYVSVLKKGSSTFNFENLKAGKYKVIAIQDKNGDFKYQPKNEKIAFINESIDIQNSKPVRLKLFKEKSKFKTYKPTQESSNKYFLGYEGEIENLKLSFKDNNEEKSLNYSKLSGGKNDTLQFFLPDYIKDSVHVFVRNNGQEKDFMLNIRKLKYKDTLSIDDVKSNNLNFNDTFKLNFTTPIQSIDESKINLLKKDSSLVKFSTRLDNFKQELEIVFEKEELQGYKVKLFPGALVDMYGQKNDSLDFKFKTLSKTDFGNLNLKVTNINRFPFIIELLKDDGVVVANYYSEKEDKILFENIVPSLYSIRIIYDDNKNKKWDTGNYITKQQPEEIIYFPGKIDVRANWDVEQEFELIKK